MSGDDITMVGDDGVAYTLRVMEREIWFSTGETLVLNGEQFDAVYAEFRGTIEADRLVPQLQQMPQYSDPNCVPNPEAGVFCTYSIDPGVPTGEGDLSQFQWRLAPEGSKRPKRKAVSSSSGEQLALSDEGSETGDAFTSVTPVSFASYTPNAFKLASAIAYQYSAHCNEIATIALQATADFGGRRTGWIRDVFNTAVIITAGVATRRIVLAGSVAAGLLQTRLADRAYSRVRMSILAVDWNSYYCRNYHITTGPIWMEGGGGTGGGGGSAHCVPTTLEISFDGGGSYTYVTAMVCHYH